MVIVIASSNVTEFRRSQLNTGPRPPKPKKNVRLMLRASALCLNAICVSGSGLEMTFASHDSCSQGDQPRPPPSDTSRSQKGHEPMNDPAQTPIRMRRQDTRSGCASVRSSPWRGKRRCRLHGGLSTGPKTPAGRAAISAAKHQAWALQNWREKQAKES